MESIKKVQGKANIELNEKGIKQAEETRETCHFSGRFLGINVIFFNNK